MQNYELKLTDENILQTYLDNSIGRNDDIFRFAYILNNIEDSCSIAIEGDWGSGKSFFVKQLKMFLDANNPCIVSDKDMNDKIKLKLQNSRCLIKNEDIKPQLCVYYDAWENDNDEDPILSLVYSIVSNIESDYSLKKRDYLKIAASILEFFKLGKWDKIIESFKSASPLDEIKKFKGINNQIEEFLNSLLPEKADRLIIFIDELDRCKPSYAVKLLERIKHYFLNDKITFVFSVNINELQHTIKRYYGNDFNANRYLDRFFDLRISLPPVDMSLFYKSINFKDTSYIFDSVIKAVINTYKFSLREITRYITMCKMAGEKLAYNHKKDNLWFYDKENIQFIVIYVLPVILGLKMHNRAKYEDFINGQDFMPLVEVYKNLNDSLISRLICDNETFDIEDTSRKFVTLEDKIKELYEILFVCNDNYKNVKIGNYNFNRNLGEILLRKSGLLSDDITLNNTDEE